MGSIPKGRRFNVSPGVLARDQASQAEDGKYTEDDKGEIMEQMTIDFSQSLSNRDRGSALASENAGQTWNERATEIALSFFRAAGHDGALFEDVRAYAELLGLPAPPSPNAWGAVALSMSKRKFIVKTGVWLNCRSVKSHACSAPLWRIK